MPRGRKYRATGGKLESREDTAMNANQYELLQQIEQAVAQLDGAVDSHCRDFAPGFDFAAVDHLFSELYDALGIETVECSNCDRPVPAGTTHQHRGNWI